MIFVGTNRYDVFGQLPSSIDNAKASMNSIVYDLALLKSKSRLDFTVKSKSASWSLVT